MRVPANCCAAIALSLCVLPLTAQEDELNEAVDLSEQLALDTNALVVLPIEILTTDSRAPALAAEAYELILDELASIDSLYVIRRESVLPYADSALSAVEIARELGVGAVLEGSIRADLYTISLDAVLINARSGEPHGSETSLLWLSPNVHISNPPFNLDTLMPDMAVRVAEEVETTLFPTADPQPYLQPDPQQAIAEAEAKVLDASLSDSERLDALKLLRFQREGLRGSAVVIAAVQIAMSSDDSDVRGQVWREMAAVRDPYLVQPLLQALANDLDQGVRKAAADTLLRDFIEEPDVRGALEYAAENDASEWTRSEIRLSMLSGAERHEALLAIVTDTTLPDMERLGAAYGLRHSGRSPMVIRDPTEFSRDEIIAIVDLAINTRSRRTRSEAISVLNGADDPYLVEPLLTVLEKDSYELARDAAAKGLVEFPDEAGVREGLESALVNDPSPLVRKTAGESLQAFERQ